jgi:hypothetical protein
MRRNATGPITSEMYRHFATVTVALTALVAFFANGESQQAVAAASESHRAEPAVAKKTPIQPETDADGDSGSFGSDDNAGFGQPMTQAGGSGSWFSNPFGMNANRRGLAGGGSALPFSGDTDQPSTEGSAAAQPSAAQIAAIAAASRLRSGSRGAD